MNVKAPRKPKKPKRKPSNIKKEIQTHFNRMIRERDILKGTIKPRFICISCQGVKPITQMDAGHFFPVRGYDGLRFNPDNVHGQCKACNNRDKAHLVWYYPNLKAKIGPRRFYNLLAKAQRYKKNKPKWTHQGLLELLKKYKNGGIY